MPSLHCTLSNWIWTKICLVVFIFTHWGLNIIYRASNTRAQGEPFYSFISTFAPEKVMQSNCSLCKAGHEMNSLHSFIHVERKKSWERKKFNEAKLTKIKRNQRRRKARKLRQIWAKEILGEFRSKSSLEKHLEKVSKQGDGICWSAKYLMRSRLISQNRKFNLCSKKWN